VQRPAAVAVLDGLGHVLGGDGIGAAFPAMANRHAGGVVVTDDAMLNSNSGRIAEIAVQKRLRQPATQISWRRAA